MIVIPQENTSMSNLLSSFENGNEELNKPNIDMRIETSQTSNKQNLNKRTIKNVRCKGKLVRKGGKYVPEVVCSTNNIQLPKMQEQNRDNLLKEILGEVTKNKETNLSSSMQVENKEHPLKPPCLSKKPKKPCGCRKKLPIDRTPPLELFPEMNRLATLPKDTNSNNNGESLLLNNIKKSGLSKKSKGKKNQKGLKNGKSKKRKYKRVLISVKGKKPKIPVVNVMRNKKASKKKVKSKSLKVNQL